MQHIKNNREPKAHCQVNDTPSQAGIRFLSHFNLLSIPDQFWNRVILPSKGVIDVQAARYGIFLNVALVPSQGHARGISDTLRGLG